MSEEEKLKAIRDNIDELDKKIQLLINERASCAQQVAEIKIKAGENGKLFGSVTTKEIAQEFKSQHNIEIDKKKIELKDPIKTVGTHEVLVKLHSEVNAKSKVIVTGI